MVRVEGSGGAGSVGNKAKDEIGREAGRAREKIAVGAVSWKKKPQNAVELRTCIDVVKVAATAQ